MTITPSRQRHFFTILLVVNSLHKENTRCLKNSNNNNNNNNNKSKTTLDPHDCEQWENQMLIPEINQSESAIFHYANNKRDLDLFFTCKHKNNTCLLPTSSFINPLDKIVATSIIMD